MIATRREISDTEAKVRRVFPAIGVACSAIIFGFAVFQGWWAFAGPIGGVLVGSLTGFAWTLSTKHVRKSVAIRRVNHKLSFSLISLYITLLFLMEHAAFRSRPIVIYGALGAISILLSRQILVNNRFDVVLVQITIVAIATYYSSQIVYPAGAYNVDTERLIPMIEQVIATGGVNSSMFYSVTPGHQILIAMLSQTINIEVKETYIFTSLVAMGVSILVLSVIRHVFPSIGPREALFAVLLCAFASFTLRRGLFPFKGNFFRPLILIVVIYLLKIARVRGDTRYLTVVSASFLGLVTGHQYSSGMATIIITSIAGYSIWRWVLPIPSKRVTVRRHVIASMLFLVALLSYSIYATQSPGLIKRIAGLLISLIELSDSSRSTGGRYTQIDPFVLIISTLSQLVLYAIGTFGIVISLQRVSLQLDRLLTWIGAACLMLALSAFVNAFVIPTPRVHGLLALFGLNIVGGIGLVELSERYGQFGVTTTHVIIAVFVVFSLASPIAGASLSVVDDEVPQYRKFQTAHEPEFEQWTSTYTHGDFVSMEVPSSEVEVSIIDDGPPARGVTNTTQLPPGTLYQYNQIAADTGIRTANKPILGGRNYAFVSLSNATMTDSQVYTSGEQHLYLKKE